MNIDILITLECIVAAVVLVILGIAIKVLIKDDLMEIKKGSKNKHNGNKQISYTTTVETADEIIFIKDDEEFHYKKN